MENNARHQLIKVLYMFVEGIMLYAVYMEAQSNH